jgi:hypothetical protein
LSGGALRRISAREIGPENGAIHPRKERKQQ